MNNEVIKGVIEIADKHAGHIRYAVEKLAPRIPFTENDIKSFTYDDILVCEIFINRFSKLQDLIGTKLFTYTLDFTGELVTPMSLIDKLNHLEKLTLVDSSKWKELRETRNHLAHEYPDRPELTARYLNEALRLSTYLLEVLESLKAFLSSHESSM